MVFGIAIENNTLIFNHNLPSPVPQPHEILIKVAYAGVNRADIFQRQGKYPPPEGASPLPGLEVSGEIAAIGAHVTGWKVGDKVMALLEGGGYAEYAAVNAGQVLPVPRNWSQREAAALPEALFTNWLALIETGNLKSGETLLIHGGASGIGSLAIPLAKLLGATVIATAGTVEKAAYCLERGAARAIHYREQDFSEIIPKQSVDVILDMVGGDYMQKNLALLRRGGRLVQLAFLRGAKSEMNLAPLLLNQLTWQGITLRSQSSERKAELARALLAACSHWLENKQLTLPISHEFPLVEAQKAHEIMEENLNLGKIVLKVAPH